MLAGTVLAGQTSPDAAPALVQTVAILPFANISGAGWTSGLVPGSRRRSRLTCSRAPGLDVLFGGALERVLRARAGAGEDLTDEVRTLNMCRELGATWLIVGGYQRVANRLRITARLLAVDTGAVVHTVKIDGTVEELFVLQDRVADALAAHLGTAGDLSRRRARDDSQPVVRPESLRDPTDRSETAGPVGGGLGPLSTVPVPQRIGRSEVAPLVIDGPPPPEAPQVVSRDVSGRVTIRATEIATPLTLDGWLDEAIYTSVYATLDFVQQEPQEGSPATERTDVWVFFDHDRIYFSFRCWESEPDRLIVNEMRRDNGNVYANDHIAFILDTFHDRRNGVEFLVNPIGGRMDGQVTNESLYNGDWNPIWDVAVGEFDGGWTVETAIPFKSLRYRSGADQIWGINVRRVNVWKNEHSFLARVPAAMGGNGIFQVSRAATLVGLEAPPRSTNLDVKPFVITDLTTDRTVTPPISKNLGGDVGLDVKYGVTQNLVADLTVNTDFAQVEADEQQVNLTRFSLFFPEKREFFLENQGGVRVWRRWHGAIRRQRQHAGPLLQPPDRIAGGSRRSDPRWWSTDRPCRQVQRRRSQYSDGRCPDRRRPVDKFHRRSCEARSTQAQQHRRTLHKALGLHAEHGLKRDVWPRRHVRVLRQSQHQHLLGQDPDRRVAGGRHQLSGAARLQWRSVRCPAGTACGRRVVQPRSGVSTT